jgi:short-subunit dehydrogenase
MADRTILITGASSGIGAALARAYAGPGVSLILWGRDQARLGETAAAAHAKGAQCATDAFDIRDLDGQLARLKALSNLDIAIFNAGLGGSVPPDRIAEDPARARATAEVNFVAPVTGASFVAGEMAKRGRGRIVLIGSIAESYPLPMAPTYAATKAGLRLFAEALGLRLRNFGVTVTLVSPGFIDTPMSQQLNEPRPFLITADRAARDIVRGVAAGKASIVTPWQFAMVRFVTDLLPRGMLRVLLSRP